MKAPRVLVAVVGILLLGGCAPVVPMEPAPEAADPTCAEVTVRLPDELGDLEKRETDAQATGAWGSPAQVFLRCGVTPPGPTTLDCREFAGVDWIIDDSGDALVFATTYGRTPTVEVGIDLAISAPGEILAALGPAISRLPVTSSCS